MRYNFLIDVINKIKPKSIIEIGVHSGKRAEAMCGHALIHCKSLTYTGYDLWQDLEEHDLVSNGKGPSHIKTVDKKLAGLRRNCPLFNYQLIKGDTAITLKPDTRADLVFIDGDHRDWAIQRDYDRSSSSPVIVLDDYYNPPIIGLGANNLIVDSSKCVQIIKSDDRIKNSKNRINLMLITDKGVSI